MPKKSADDEKRKQKQDDRMVKELLRGANKKNGNWRDTWNQFCDQMRAIGLKMRDVKPDGNCLFRSFADQLEGNEHKHDFYRESTVDYMEAHADDFAPFIEADFKLYCKKMRQDGSWGGNLELQALAMAHRVLITIHQLDAPRFEIRNQFDDAFDPRMIHLSYHDGEHYCSVRALGDDCRGPPEPIVLPENPNPILPQQRPAEDEPKNRNEKIVLDLTGCKNLAIIREALADNLNDVDATVEFLIGLKAIGADDDWDSPSYVASSASAVAADASAVASSSLSSKRSSSSKSPPPSRNKAVASSSSSSNAVDSSSSSSSASSSSSNGADALEKLEILLESTDPGRKCICQSGKPFKQCCMNRMQQSVQRMRGDASIAKAAEEKAKALAAASASSKLSNKERKELQRLEKEQAESQGGSGKLGKVKTKKGGKEEAPPSASQRVVGI